MINELEYLEAMNQLKTKFDENEIEVKKLKKEVVELKKYIMTIYGLARIIDSNFARLKRVDKKVDISKRDIMNSLPTQIRKTIGHIEFSQRA